MFKDAEREGFTLVELSIVLVIIGLLIGGILVGQSMISTSKITATIQQLGQFDAGVENFKTEYGYLPGDAPAFGGDGNGLIEDTAGGGTYNALNVYSCELANFWNNFSPSDYSSTACSPIGARAIRDGAGKNVPKAALGSKGSFFIASAITYTSVFADPSDMRNFFAILDGTEIQSLDATYNVYTINAATSSDSAVKPVDLLALDKKIDDGIANTGNVLSGGVGVFGGGGTNGGIITTPLATCSSGATYQVQNNTYECTPLIRIGAQAGDPD